MRGRHERDESSPKDGPLKFFNPGWGTPRAESGEEAAELRGQIGNATSWRKVVRKAVKLGRRHHLTCDQTKLVVEDARRELRLAAPRESRRTVDRLDRVETEQLIETTYRRASSSGLKIKTLFYAGARVSEVVNLRVEDLHLAPDPLRGWTRASESFCPVRTVSI